MDSRLYYVVGDFVVSLIIGMVAGLAAWALVGPGWNMWAAMAAMMPLSLRHALEMGAACGIAEIIFIWIANTILRGVIRDTKAG